MRGDGGVIYLGTRWEVWHGCARGARWKAYKYYYQGRSHYTRYRVLCSWEVELDNDLGSLNRNGRLGLGRFEVQGVEKLNLALIEFND